MGYLHIDNLYKEQTILMFKECYALEKIHGTSAHISWNSVENKIRFFSGGEDYTKFISLFDVQFLQKAFIENFPNSDVIVFGEAYGGKQQGMSKTYGKELKFIGFDVKIDKYWLNVPNAENVCQKLNIEFVHYVKVSTNLDELNRERDKPSTQAKRNGILEDKPSEGVVLRPLFEFTTNNGGRVISKYKRDEFGETKTPREVTPEQLKVLEDAKAISDEWVTENRLFNIFSHLSDKEIDISNIPNIIKIMIDDIKREGDKEIIFTKEVNKEIGKKTVKLVKMYFHNLIK